MDNPDLLNNELQVSPATKSYLNEVAKWSKFLAVIGIILCVIGAVLSFFIPSVIMEIPPNDTLSPSLSGWQYFGIIGVSLLIAIVFFFPFLYLYKFSETVRQSLETGSQEGFEKGVKYLKFTFRFLGIMAVILISLYSLIFIITMIRLAVED